MKSLVGDILSIRSVASCTNMKYLVILSIRSVSGCSNMKSRITQRNYVVVALEENGITGPC